MAAIDIIANTVRVQYVVSAQLLFLGNLYECYLFIQHIVSLRLGFDTNSYIQHYQQ